jgi:hypothetical protein
MSPPPGAKIMSDPGKDLIIWQHQQLTKVSVLEEKVKVAERLAEIPVLQERIKAVEQSIAEKNSLYLEKFRASEEAVKTAITASDRQTTSSFASSEKAIVKAEEAQREYNVRSNEFRGQLDDQAKTLMPRLEAQTLFKSYEDKLDTTNRAVEVIRKDLQDARVERKNEIDSLRTELMKEIQSLRETRSQVQGVEQAKGTDKLNLNNNFMAIMAFLLLLATIYLALKGH